MAIIGDGIVDASGGVIPTPAELYTPAMMEFDGSTGYFSTNSLTTSGNKVTVVLRFKRAQFTGAATELLSWCENINRRWGIRIFSSDHATTGNRNKVTVRVKNSAGTDICWLLSTAEVVDGNLHTLFFAFDGDTGSATFIIDGINADDTGFASRVAPTTGTLNTGASSVCTVGAGNAGTVPSAANIGFFGHREAYLTNWQDFMESDGRPKQLDESSWTEWGAQPLYWNEHGDMENNFGSAGNMTRNGTVIVGDGGN